MARTEKEVISSISTNISNASPTLDVKKGPIYNFLIAPISPVIVTVESNTDRLERLLSLDMVNASENTDDITAFGNNFKVPRGGGKKEQHLQTFYTFSKPNATINIPTGTLVGSSERTYVYRVISGSSFLVESAESYYNNTNGRYELNLMVEAVDYGTDYNLPKGRVNTLISELSIDGTVSASDSLVLGTEVETDSDYMSKVEQRFTGLNSGNSSGIQYTINENLGISDSKIFKPGDDVFTRKVKRAALDIYVNRFNTSCKVQNTTVEYDTDTITLEESPVLSVDSVVINGVEVDFTFNKDVDVDTAGSSSSNDTITIDKITSGTTVTITYYINSDVQDTLNLFTEKDLYDSDIYVRQPFTVYLNLEVIIKTNTVNKDDAKTQALDAIASFPEYTMGETLYPKNLEQQLKSVVPNIISVYIIEHNIDGQSSNICTVSLNQNEIINVDNAIVKVL